MALVKQYVNLPGTTGVLGPTIHFKVTPNQVPNVAPGDRVDWWVEPDPKNMDLKYQFKDDRTHLKFEAPRAGKGSKANRYFDNDLTLTQIGGDRYTVKAARDGQRGNFVASDQYETWRKLYYSVWYSHPESLGRFNNIENRWKDAFRRTFVELEQKTIQQTLTYPVSLARLDYRSLARQQSGVGAHDWPFMTGGPGAMMNLRNGGGNPAGATLSDKPLHMALLLVPDLYMTQLERMTFDPTTVVAGSTPTYKSIFRDPANGGKWLWTAQASWSGAGATNVESYFTFTPGWPTQINWDLRALAGLTPFLATPGKSFRLDFSYIYRPPVGGYSWGNFSVVACTNMPEGLVLQALTHETGHAAGQAIEQEPLYDVATGAKLGTLEKNPQWYNDPYGGTGPHCHLNAILTPDPTTSSGQIYTWGGGAQMCPMFYMLNSDSDPDHFCAFCEPRTRRRDLRTPTGAAGTWNDFG